MRSQKVVLIACGENAGTRKPFCFLENFTGDFSETKEVFMNWDCNLDVTVSVYTIKEILLPEWMNESFYINNWIAYKFAIGLGGEFVYTLDETAMTNFFKLNEAYQYFIGQYMKGNTKNPFKISIREQILNWLSVSNNPNKTPLSNKQFEIASKYCRLWEAKCVSNRIYWEGV
jgi:hypothetical protein